uniref:hypothetical protein n=1 Tax=uncultured Tenacibaculum sp. TaxID=174713 RepID=UPI00261D6DD7|nr:hypothetical protein [uncultured Tenacibaculum sp.]
MVSTLIKNILFSIITALGCITDTHLMFEYVCTSLEPSPKYYGFPFVQEADTTCYSSLTGEIYIYGFLGNWLVSAIIIYVIVNFIITNQSFMTTLIKGFVCIWALFTAFVYFVVTDWKIHPTHNNFKTVYHLTNGDCKMQFLYYKK